MLKTFTHLINKAGIDQYSLAFLGIGALMGLGTGAMMMLGIIACDLILPPIAIVILGGGIGGAGIFYTIKAYLDSQSLPPNDLPINKNTTYSWLQAKQIASFQDVKTKALHVFSTPKVLPKPIPVAVKETTKSPLPQEVSPYRI